MLDEEMEFFRIMIKKGKGRSSVSMDAYLAQILIESLPKEITIQQWVQQTCDQLDQLWQIQAMQSKLGQRIHAKSGFSRQVQREAIKFIVEKLKNQDQKKV